MDKDSASRDLLTRAFQQFADRDEPQPAARCAFWLAFQLLNAGEWAPAGGWLGRANRLLEGGTRC